MLCNYSLTEEGSLIFHMHMDTLHSRRLHKMGLKEVVQLLIVGGANPNKADENKSTPLHEAAREGHKDVVQMLLDEGADLNVEDKGGYTPFYMAFEHDHKDVEQLFLEKGAKPHLVNSGSGSSKKCNCNT